MDLAQVLRLHAEERPDAPAILAPGRTALTFAGLSAHVRLLSSGLAGSGLDRRHPLAAVLPDDSQTLCAFLAAFPVMGFAPLNPELREAEFKACFQDMQPSALLVPEGAGSPAVEAAQAMEIPVIECQAAPEKGAGVFQLPGLKGADAAPVIPDPSALALSLQTSATTGQAKCVCLTQANLEAMIRASVDAMRLSHADRFLNMMPLFHLQGLLSALGQLAAGGSVICAAPFDTDRFRSCVTELRPTWYTAGPALHRTILGLWRETPELARHSQLRFVRSIGASLPGELLHELEENLRVPILEGYGLTETGAVTTTPLAPYVRKAGSAGARIVPGVEIMDPEGNLAPPGQEGEIVVRGPGVMREYRNNPEATSLAFRDGWFRTGDLGRFDEDGFLYVIGRLKEIVNRGGEKILPAEVDPALMAHPAVADAAAFGVPHPQLGEDLAAALVLRAGEQVDEGELREFLKARLAPHKVPRVFLFMARLPRGASGKVQRVRLAEEFAERKRARPVTVAVPGTPDEQKLAAIWAAVLGISIPGIDDDFFELGGHSLASARIMVRIEEVFGVTLPHDALLAAPTVRRLAAAMHSLGARTEQVVAIQPEGSRPPFFMLRPLPVFRPLAAQWGNDHPFLGVAMPGREQLTDDSDLKDVARQLVSVVRKQQPSGPYYLGGWCADGVLAFEMAQQLAGAGEQVALLALFDPPNPEFSRNRTGRSKGRRLLDTLHWRVRFQLGSLRQLAIREVPPYVAERSMVLARHLADSLRARVQPAHRGNDNLFGLHHPSGIRVRIRNYLYSPYFGRLTVFRAADQFRSVADPANGWSGIARGGLTVHSVPGDHLSMFQAPNVQILGEKLASELERADAAAAAKNGAFLRDGRGE